MTTLPADLERVLALEALSKGNGCDVIASDDPGFWNVSMVTPWPNGGTGFLCGFEAFHEEDARFVAATVNLIRNHGPALRSALDNYAKLLAFAKEIVGYLPEGSPDGCDLHEAAVKHGLLIGQEVTERCGENCHCAGYGDDWPMECFRIADFMRNTDDSARAQEAGK